MAITTLTELETAVADRLARTDFTAAQIDECIAFSEARMQRQLRTTDMETKTEEMTLTGEYTPVPVDFLGVRDFYVNGAARRQLSMRSLQYLTERYPTVCSGIPVFYAVVGNNFRFAPVPNGDSATLIYYAKIPALSTTNTSNWVLRNHPDCYLYGALTEAAVRLQDQMAATGYGNLFANALESIQASNNRSRYTGPAMTVSPG